MSDQCEHNLIERRESGPTPFGFTWNCAMCSEVFMPAKVADDMARTFDVANGAIGSVLADALWKLNQRSVEHTGIGVDQIENLPEQVPDLGGQSSALCEHKRGFESGSCVECGASMYLGGDA